MVDKSSVPEPVADLLSYIDASPTPYHCVAESVRRLRAEGYRAVPREQIWSLEPGARCFVTRDDGSLIAFEIGSESPALGGFRMIGAHTDSPNLRLKPSPDLLVQGYRQLGVEMYGGLLLHTWLDRDLSIAGRVLLTRGGSLRTLRIDFERPLLRIPNLAIHLNREVVQEGLKLNPQLHALPVLGLESTDDLQGLLLEELRQEVGTAVRAEDILAFDLMLYDTQPSGLAGASGEFVLAPRLDNQASCHAGLRALLGAASADLPRFTRLVVLYDHEEVGSQSARGASGPLLTETLERIIAGFKGGEPQGLPRSLARSLLVSADMAHAVHPSYADRHDPTHSPRIGGGPVIKTHASQAYATDAGTAGIFTALCREAGFEPQQFVSRSDQRCGSTIGPISAARAGLRTVDVGNPMLSMHSCREMAGSADVEPMIRVLQRFFEKEVDLIEATV